MSSLKAQRPLVAIAFALAAAFGAGTTHAAIISVGDVYPDPSAPGVCGGATINCTLSYGPLLIGKRFVDSTVANGNVTVNGGSALSSPMGFFAGANNGNGSSGTLTITGAGSQFLIPVGPGNFNIGFGPGDVGSVVVENGGRLTTSGGAAPPSDIGTQEGSTGTLTIRTGGRFDFAGPWLVLGGGMSGGISGATTSGSLIVEQGGIANVTGFIGTGNFSGSNATLRISDSASVLRIDPAGGDQALTIGSDGIGNANVLVEKGGLLQTVNGPLILGAAVGYQHVVTVRDAGSRIDLGTEQLKALGTGGVTTVSVLDGAALNAGSASVSKGTLLVSGTGSTLDLAPGATLTLGVGGKLSVQSGAQAFIGGLTPGTPVPTFPGSASLLGVGLSSAGTLAVQGGTVEGSYTIVGSAGTASVVNGGQVSMSQAFHLGMGTPGTAALTIASGGQVTAPSILIGSGGGSAAVSVSGPASRLDALGATPAAWPGLYVGGDPGSVGSLTLQARAQSSALNFGVGFSSGSTGTANVQGGSFLESLGTFTVGVYGQGALTLSGEGAAKARNASVGQSLGATGTVTVRDPGSILTLANVSDASASMAVGRDGVGTLNVVDGGRVLIDAIPTNATRFGSLVAGGGFGAANPPTGTGSINVNGPGAEIRFVQHAGGATQYFATTIGWQGAGALNITNGGRVVNENMDAAFSIVGRAPTGVGTVLVDGPGSRWDAGKRLFVATNANADSSSTGFMTPIGNGGAGTVTISNGSLIKVSDYAYIAAGGTLKGDGTLDGDVIVAGGSVMPGTSPGTLAITGDFTMDSGILEIEVAGLGPGQFDILHIGGNAHLNGGIIRFAFIDGFLPHAGDVLDFLLANTLSLGSVGYEYSGAAPGFQFDINWTGGALRFAALSDAAAAPEPSTLALLGLGLAGLAATRRRKR